MQTLLDALDHREPDIRWAVALLLIRIAKQNVKLVSRLIDLSATGTANQKRMALYCIRDLVLSDAASLAASVNALSDVDPTVRVAAAICLKPRADLKDDGRNLLLKVYLEDPDLRVRNAAAIVLANLGSPSEEFLIALRAASESKNGQTRKTAVAALDLLEKRRSAPAGRPGRWPGATAATGRPGRAGRRRSASRSAAGRPSHPCTVSGTGCSSRG